MDSAIKKSDAIEKNIEKRLDEMYKEAYKQSIKNQNEFMSKLKELDELYKDTADEKILLQKEIAQKKLIREYNVSQSIANDLAKTGKLASEMIKSEMGEIYSVNQKYIAKFISDSIPNASFTIYDRNQLNIIINSEMPSFSKIAYNNLGQDANIVRRLNNQLAQSTILGETQSELIKRIQLVTSQSLYQAKRVAQTERNRVQSEARYDTMEEAKAMGINVKKKWSTRMVNSRESHVALDNKVIEQDETFDTINGNSLRFPGDPLSPPSETINCHCVLVPVVEE